MSWTEIVAYRLNKMDCWKEHTYFIVEDDKLYCKSPGGSWLIEPGYYRIWLDA
jgi:hypothetical protein